jgi:uncharacterized protein YecE (DUF72 family)
MTPDPPNPELFPLAPRRASDRVDPELFPRPPDPIPSTDDRVLIGTSGYSFADWVGPFYPPGTKSSEFLFFYTRHFSTVEVNSTHYGIPHPRVIEQMARKTPPGFHFVVKLNRAFTHENSRDPSLYRDFLAVLEPLKAAGKYDGVLAQFPWAFKRTSDNAGQLETLRERLPDEPLFVEFRHDSWMTPELGPWLKERGLGYCSVDEPQLRGLMPPVTMVTSEDAYVRLHGRNAENWWGRGGGDRYDYSYSEDELKEWLRKISELADKARRTYLFFNNCHAGQAARNAKLMQEMLRQQRLAG